MVLKLLLVVVAVGKLTKRYSAFADHPLHIAHSTPPPAVQPSFVVLKEPDSVEKALGRLSLKVKVPCRFVTAPPPVT